MHNRLIGAAAFLILITGCAPSHPPIDAPVSVSSSSATKSSAAVSSFTASSVASGEAPEAAIPLTRALERITKKHFGTYVTPKNSPVSPEKFTGYHTGTDFEILQGEENTDVQVFAICEGKVRIVRFVNGYGGVLIQECTINNQTVTVLYGHLRLASISAKAGSTLAAGQVIAVLGTGYSSETDGERKHLHLSIHLGSAIEYRGYVSSEKDLRGWMDPEEFFEISPIPNHYSPFPAFNSNSVTASKYSPASSPHSCLDC